MGVSDGKTIVENTYRYIQTPFFRFLLMLAVSSINLSADKFQFILLQDFTPDSDIDWNQRVDEIDGQLYRKFGLTEEEVSFIRGMVKWM